MVLPTTPTQADTAALAWDPVSHPNLAGYRVYFGTVSGNYTQTVDTGLATQATLTGLSSCTDYFIAVKARTTDGTESTLFSNELVGWARPQVTTASPATVEPGNDVTLTIDGANFQSGATVAFSDPAISVNNVTVTGCFQLTVDASVGAGASLGPVDVTVTNANGIFGQGSGLINVTTDQTPPSLSSIQASSVTATTALISWDSNEPADSRVLYREVGETVYQQTPVDTNLVTNHSITLTGLSPVTEYEVRVESTDAAGNTAAVDGPQTFVTATNSFTYIRFEAESGEISPPAEINTGGGAFVEAWINLAPGTGSGSQTNPAGTWDYGVHLPSAGNWQFWFRMYGLGGNRNGWFESVDGAAFGSIVASQNDSWTWVAGRSYSLSAGLHTLTLGGNEAEARIDRVLVTNDPAFLPTEQPGGNTTAPAGVLGLTAVEGDGTVRLDWTHPSDTDLQRVVLRYRVDGVWPLHPDDGLPLLDQSAQPSSAGSYDHTGLTNGVALRYSVFAIDDSGNASFRVSVEATPQVQTTPPDQVQNLRRNDTN